MRRTTKEKNEKPEQLKPNSFRLWTKKDGVLMVSISDSKGKIKHLRIPLDGK